jgi:hypothetical protein
MKLRYLVSTKKPGLEFRILERTVNEDQSLTLKLLGATGVNFERRLTPDLLEQYGYALEVRESEGAQDAVVT